MQIVTYPQLPGREPKHYIGALAQLHQFITDMKPSFKDFKRYLRENDMYNKEGFDGLMGFLGVTAGKGKDTTSSKFLKDLAGEQMPEDRKKVLFRFLAKKNEILIKYVMDGLAERLYSTNELYRFITSYVYPGAYITLVNFRAWMEWLQASGHIKMIGIRWGLSPLGEEAMNYIKIIDVDDILEEEEEGWGDSDGDEDEDEDDDEGPATSPPVEETTEPEAAETKAAEPADAEDTPEPTPTAEPAAAEAPRQPAVAKPAGPQAPTRAVAATGPARVVVPEGVETVQVMVQPIKPQVDDVPLKLVKEAFEAADEEEDIDQFGEPQPALGARLDALRVDEELVAENVRAVLAWWQGRPGGRLLESVSYGFTKEMYEEEPAFTLYRMASLAVCLFRHEGQLNVGRGGEAFGLLDQMGFFTNAFKSRKSVDTVLEELFTKGGLANRPEIFSNLHYFILFKRALKELKDDGVKGLIERGGPEDIVGALWQHLGHFSLHYEILWIARELENIGAWPETLQQIGVVPLPRARENAFKLGLLETPYVADFPALVGASRRLSKLFPKSVGYEAPLVYFEPRRVLRYDTAQSAYFTRDELGI